MGLLDDLKHKAGELGDKAKEGLDAAKDKAGDLAGDVKDRLGHHDDSSPLGESSDIAPDGGPGDVVSPETADLDPVDVDAAEALDDEEDGAATGAVEPSAEDSVTDLSDVDPFDEPLSETIGDDISADEVDADAVSEAVGRPAPDAGSQG